MRIRLINIEEKMGKKADNLIEKFIKYGMDITSFGITCEIEKYEFFYYIQIYISEIMKNEAREEAEKILNTAATIVKEATGIVPVLHTREGEIISELKKLIEEEEGINVLVLAANTNENEKNPGPIINALISREISTLRIPVMIVPGNFSKDHISQIT